MLFNSMSFLVFYPVVFFVYFSLPKRVRYIWLLLSSYFFYMSWNAKYALLMLFSTAVTYAGGLLIERLGSLPLPEERRQKYQKCCVVLSLVLNLAVLFLFKYLDFAIANLNLLFAVFHFQLVIPKFDLLLPVGISFYTFQALGYTIDVYQKKVPAERNFLKYALFVSFFPQLVAGPIERSENLLGQIHEPREFSVSDARYGLLTMAYGLFLKVVLADNIAAVVDPIFENYQAQSGMRLLLATVLFAFQVYADFNGYTQIAIGSARALGFRLMENFQAPYLARSIKDFWKRWHISLTLWFQDYLYMPLAMADTEKLTGGKLAHLPPWLCQLFVFLCSGLWHGAAWHYVIWGGINGLYITLYDATKRSRKRLSRRIGFHDNIFWQCVCWVGTFALVDFSLLFFRANSAGIALQILYKIIFAFGFSIQSILELEHLRVIAGSLCALFVMDLCVWKGKDFRKIFFKLPLLCRWIAYLAILFIIVYFGAYGEGYETTQFLYFQF